MEQNHQDSKPKASIKVPSKTKDFVTYAALVGLFSILILIFSLIMASIASYRNDISYDNYEATSRIYKEDLNQYAPQLDIIEENSEFYVRNKLTKQLVRLYIDNTSLIRTSGNVVITADFVKKGLTYQPTYKTEFKAVYILKNDLEKESFITFRFPFPTNTSNSEISNAVLKVDGEEIPDAKSQFNNGNHGSISGLRWTGKVKPLSETRVEVSYSTVGLSRFVYEGIENSKGSQDFDFSVKIVGTRSYDIAEGLSVNDRKFGDNEIELIWTKPSLLSKPLINVSIGDKLNPSEQVSRIYMTMAPIYVVFSTIILYLAYKFGRKIGGFDLFLITILFVIFFPFVHYLSSFTIDPTVELFTFLNTNKQFSMPLYGAFAVAWVVIGGMIYYLLGRVSGFSFSTKFGIPAMLLFIGFFPLVVTIPEYSMLLVIIGGIALMAIILQVRIKLMRQN